MKRIAIVLLITFSALSAHAQGYTSLDAVAYQRGADSIQLEVYYSILQKLLPFHAEGEKWTAKIAGAIEVFQDGKQIARKQIDKEKVFTGTEDELKKHIADDVLDGAFFAIAAKPNTEVLLILNDLTTDSKNRFTDSIRRHVDVPSKEKTGYRFGNIEFCNSVEKTADRSNFFEKVGYIVTPNPSNTYGGNLTKLYYYCELQLPEGGKTQTSTTSIQLRIIDGEDHEMYKSNQAIILDADIIPLIGSAEIEGLPTNSYVLELTLMHDGKQEAKCRRTFYYDSGIELADDERETAATTTVDENSLYLTSDFSKMTELELEERSTQSLYPATETQRKEYKKLSNLDAKRRWLFDYWRAKDKENPKAQPLSGYRAIQKLVDDANKYFGIMKTPGWKTARGRVLIQYGKPDQVTDHRFEVNAKPYIVWDYVGLKIPLVSGTGAQFVFLDRQGGGNFILIHSNVRGEVQEDDWYTREALRTSSY